MDTEQTRTLSNDEKVRITVEFFRNQFDVELDPAAIEKIRESILAYDRGASIGATDQLDETDSTPGIFLSPSAVRNLMASLPANDRGASTDALNLDDEAVADNVADINDAANVVITATVTATDATAPELAGMGSVLTTED
jgi:hypothetical protein